MTLVLGDDTAAEETLFRLALSDLDVNDVDRWWTYGFRNPVVVRQCIDQRLNLPVVERYRNVGLDDPDEIWRHHMADLDPEAAHNFALIGIHEPVAQRRAARNGITAKRLRLFRRAGLTDLDDMHRLLDAKVHWYLPTLLNEKFGSVTVDDVLAVHHAQIDTSEIHGLADLGVTTIAGLFANAGRGIKARDVYHFRLADPAGSRDKNPPWLSIDTVEDLLAHGIDGTTAHTYATKGDVRNRDGWKRLAATGVTAKDVEALAAIGIVGLDSILFAAQAGLTARKANNYRRAGFGGEGVIRLAAAGITAGKATAYREAGIELIIDMIAAHTGAAT